MVGGCIFFLPGCKSTKNFWNSKIFISSGAPVGLGGVPLGRGDEKLILSYRQSLLYLYPHIEYERIDNRLILKRLSNYGKI